MGNYEQLKQSVSDVIKTNGNQEITGSILQNVLLTIISTVGANATFAGIATPATNPGTPDGSVFYLASESGTYTNFGGVELQDGLSVLTWNDSWSSQQIFGIDDIPTAGSDNLVKSKGIYQINSQLSDKITNEVDRATAAETQLSDKITNEVNRATAAEKQLSNRITNEVDRATAAEKQLDDRITDEVYRATAAEKQLSDKITNEVDRATAAETQLDDRITDENNRALIEETRIEGRLNSNRFGYNVTVFGLVTGVHTLATAVKNVPSAERFGGQKITFKTDSGWVTYQNTSLDTSDYENVSNWVLDSGVSELGDVTITNNPDYEDLTQNEGGQLKFADKTYNAATYTGLGRKYLRKNIVSGVNTLTQDMLVDANTIYHIQYDYTLDENITIPENCILKFDGGSISGAHTITLDNTPIISSTKCFGEDIILDGTLYNNDFYFDWFNAYKVDKHDFTTIVVTEDTRNDIIMGNHMYKLYNYHFGSGVYPFNKPIGQIDREHTTRDFYGGNFFGQHRHQTFLYFPNSKGFALYGGDLSKCILRDFTIYSKYECFFVNIYAADGVGIAYNRYNAVHENVFENLELYSIDGDFCFGAYLSYHVFIYNNHFNHVFGWCKEGASVFSGIGDIGTKFCDCACVRYLGGYRDTVKVLPYIDGSVWDGCDGVTAYDCDISQGVKHIYTDKYAGKNATEIGLHSSLGIISSEGSHLSFYNCNFESFHGTLIETLSKYTIFTSIEFNDSCALVFDINSEIVNNNNFSAFRIRRVFKIILPTKYCKSITNYGGDDITENKIIRTVNGNEVKFNNVKVMRVTDMDTPSQYFILPQEESTSNVLPENSYEYYRTYKGGAYETLYTKNNYLQGIEISDKTVRVCKPITWTNLVSALNSSFGNRILIVEADITCNTDNPSTSNLKGIIFKGGKLLNGVESPSVPHIGLSGGVFISAEKVQIMDSAIDIYGEWSAIEVFKEWWGSIDDSTFNLKIARFSPIGTMYFDGTKPLWLKEVVGGNPVWVDATGATV